MRTQIVNLEKMLLILLHLFSSVNLVSPLNVSRVRLVLSGDNKALAASFSVLAHNFYNVLKVLTIYGVGGRW